MIGPLSFPRGRENSEAQDWVDPFIRLPPSHQMANRLSMAAGSGEAWYGGRMPLPHLTAYLCPAGFGRQAPYKGEEYCGGLTKGR